MRQQVTTPAAQQAAGLIAFVLLVTVSLMMEPRDLDVTQMARAINPAKGQGISSRHHLGAHVVLADGSVQYLNAAQTTAEVIAAMLTIDGDEPGDRRE